MLKSKAPIPDDAIGLAEAFERLCERLTDWHKIISETEALSTELDFKNIQYVKCPGRDARKDLALVDGIAVTVAEDNFSAEQNEVACAGEQLKLLILRQQLRKVEADRLMRKALASGALVAKIENPITGKPRPLNDVRRWLPTCDLPRKSAPYYLKLPPATPQHDIEYEPGFRSDHVEEWGYEKPMPEQPGPPTSFNDQTLHRVFFDRVAFKTWLAGDYTASNVANSSAGIPIPTTVLNTSKQEAVRRALLGVYEDGRVPQYLSWPEITESIRARYQKLATDPGGPSESTVRRVLGG